MDWGSVSSYGALAISIVSLAGTVRIWIRDTRRETMAQARKVVFYQHPFEMKTGPLFHEVEVINTSDQSIYEINYFTPDGGKFEWATDLLPTASKVLRSDKDVFGGYFLEFRDNSHVYWRRATDGSLRRLKGPTEPPPVVPPPGGWPETI